MAPKRKATAHASASSEADTTTTANDNAVAVPPVDVPTTTPSQSQTLMTGGATEGGASVPPTASQPPSLSSPTEIFSRLQAAIATSPAAINDHVGDLLVLMQHAESTATPLLLRVRFVEFVGRVVADLRDNAALKKIVTSLVKIISGDDDTPQLLTAAVHCFTGLGPVSMLDKRWEYLSREGADVLMQVMIDKEAFAEVVRQAAAKALDALTETAFRPVVTKLLHWLSDDREEDDAAQLATERRLALTRLGKMAFAPSMRHHWDEELQAYVLSLLPRVLSTVDAREFSQLVRIAAALPVNQQQAQIPLLEMVLKTVGNLDSARALEAVAMTGRLFANAPAGTTARPECTALVTALEQSNLLTGAIATEGDYGVLHARVLLLAARVAPAAALPTLRLYIFQQLEALVGDGAELRGNLAILEALLLAAVAVARRESTEVLQKLNEAGFNAAMTALTATATRAEQLARFAVKKRLLRVGHVEAEDGPDAELLGVLHTIVVIAGAFSAKHLPMADLKESYLARPALPTVAKGDANGRLTGQKAQVKRLRSPAHRAMTHGRRGGRRMR